MYSMVLMMALGTGVDLPACHRHGGGRHGGHCGGGYACGGGGCGHGGGCGGGYCMGGGYGGGGCAGGVCYGPMGGDGTAVVMASSTEAPATIVVNLPEDARLTIDGNPTTSVTDRRVFVSPSLATGRDFHYTLKAKVTRDGEPMTVEKTVTVRAGEETHVTLDVPTRVASR
jgi:uncharacterized protein (TIGR03000 family)